MRRRGFLASGATVAATAVAGCPYRDEETIPSLSSDWPRPRYDEGGAGYRDDWAPISEGDPSVLWSTTLDVGESDRPEPVVVDDVVYANTGTEVYAFDAADGEKRWRTSIIDEPSADWTGRGPLAVADGRLFAGSHGGLFVLDTDGRELWSVEGDGEWPASSVFGSPAVVDGTVYFAVGDTGYAYTVDGEKQWGRALESPSFVAPAVGEGAVYFASGDRLQRVLPDGTPEWTAPVDPEGYPLVVEPGVTGDGVFVPGRDAVVEVEVVTSEPRHALPIGRLDAALAVTEDYVYASGGSGHTVFGVTTDPFGVQTGRDFDGTETGVTAVGSSVYVAHEDGLWVGTRLEGDAAWTVETDQALRGGVAVTDEAVFAASRETLYGIA